MRWSSRFVAQPSAEEVIALLRSVHEITAETQGEPINKSIPSSSIVFAGPDDSNLGGCFSAANLTWSLGAKCPLRPNDFFMGNDGYRGCVLFRRQFTWFCSTPETGQSQFSNPRNIDTRLKVCLPKRHRLFRDLKIRSASGAIKVC